MTQQEKSRVKLEADVAKFLESGGTIKKIPKGVSNDKGTGFRGQKNTSRSINPDV